MEFITGLIIGVAVFTLLWYFFRKKGKAERTEEQTTVILEKIRHVAKLVTVETHFTEIMHFSSTKNSWVQLFSGQKKAIIMVDARVLAGFDLKKIKWKFDTKHKRVYIDEFPEPEVLSIEKDLRYYDIKNALFNRFKSADLTELDKKAKENILEKIPGSGILEKSREKAMDSILMMKEMLRGYGWELVTDNIPGYTAIEEGER